MAKKTKASKASSVKSTAATFLQVTRIALDFIKNFEKIKKNVGTIAEVVSTLKKKDKKDELTDDIIGIVKQ